jgi:GNAT superfamily N-acetyltransferase
MYFHKLDRGDISRHLEIMREFYLDGNLEFVENVARESAERLIERPELGRIVWIMDGALPRDGRREKLIVDMPPAPVGYFVLTVGYSLEFGGIITLLDELFVRPGFQGHGMGKKALLEAGKISREYGARALRLEVDRENDRARKLYEKTGFIAHARDIMTLRVE